MALYAASLRDLGERVSAPSTTAASPPFVDAADGSAVPWPAASARWRCFADVSRYDELTIPFLKRAQIAAADLQRAGVARFRGPRPS